jgi:hypothetical protein
VGTAGARPDGLNRSIGWSPLHAPQWVAFFDELGKGGFVEGKNLIVDWPIQGSNPMKASAMAIRPSARRRWVVLRPGVVYTPAPHGL